jgi:glycosyltransferase involved in cell wall biosynthesis
MRMRGRATAETTVKQGRTSHVPRVSIGMPVYNGECFLEEALDSVLAQSFEDFELIICDNASTDSTPDICRAYLARDRRVRYLRNHRNLGAVGNFNRVFGLASADYFKLANADDLSAPALVAQCVSVLDEHPEVVLCYPKTTLIDEKGEVTRLYEDGLDLRSSSAIDRFRLARQRIGLVNVLQGLVRSNTLRHVSPMRSYLGSDVVLVAELTLYGQFYEIPERLFFRRIHTQASSSITSLEEKQKFIAPQTNSRASLHLWSQQFGYLAAIRRSPLTPAEKVRLAYLVFRSVITIRKSLLRELSMTLAAVVNSRLRHG